jgi:hypothetical protein
MSKPDQAIVSWEEKAAFMRKVGAVHAEWDTVGDLLKITLAPQAQPGPAARMTQFHERTTSPKTAAERRHEILFAASSVRPALQPTTAAPPSAVPRAVRAKEAVARRGKQTEG